MHVSLKFKVYNNHLVLGLRPQSQLGIVTHIPLNVNLVTFNYFFYPAPHFAVVECLKGQQDRHTVHSG